MKRRLGLTVSLALVLGLGCKEAAKPAPAAKKAPPAPPAEAPATEKPAAQADTSGPIGGILADYESVRIHLAGDDIAGAVRGATTLSAAAKTAAGTVEDPKKSQLTSISDTAKAMSAVSAEDAKAVRKAFGELSRSIITLLAGDEALAKGLFAIECPMAEGYKKWVQTSEQVSNPYFGGEMLTCGSKTEMKP